MRVQSGLWESFRRMARKYSSSGATGRSGGVRPGVATESSYYGDLIVIPVHHVIVECSEVVLCKCSLSG